MVAMETMSARTYMKIELINLYTMYRLTVLYITNSNPDKKVEWLLPRIHAAKAVRRRSRSATSLNTLFVTKCRPIKGPMFRRNNGTITYTRSHSFDAHSKYIQIDYSFVYIWSPRSERARLVVRTSISVKFTYQCAQSIYTIKKHLHIARDGHLCVCQQNKKTHI